MGGFERAKVRKVRDHVDGEVAEKGSFEQDGEDGGRQQGGAEGGVRVRDDHAVADDGFGRVGGVVRRREGAEQEEGEGGRKHGGCGRGGQSAG